MAKRDYKAEYQRRIERAAQSGLSRSQARGHARTHKGEQPVSIIHPRQAKPKPEPIYKRTEYIPVGKMDRIVRTYSTNVVEKQFKKDRASGNKRVYFRVWNPHTHSYASVYRGTRNTSHGIREAELMQRIETRQREAASRGEDLSFDEAFREQLEQDSGGYGGGDSPGDEDTGYDFSQIEMFISDY